MEDMKKEKTRQGKEALKQRAEEEIQLGEQWKQKKDQMDEVINNPWKPLPLYEIKPEEIKQVKENTELDPLDLQV